MKDEIENIKNEFESLFKLPYKKVEKLPKSVLVKPAEVPKNGLIKTEVAPTSPKSPTVKIQKPPKVKSPSSSPQNIPLESLI